MAHIIVEINYSHPPTDADLEADRDQIGPCIEARDGKWIRSYLSTDRKRRICHFEAPDAESIREAYRSAGVPVPEVWTAGALVKIEDYPDWLQKREALRARMRGKSP